MSQYDSQIEQVVREMEAAEDELIQIGEISERSWMLIKGYCLGAILHNTLISLKTLESSATEGVTDAG